MINIIATMPCFDTIRPRMSAGASLTCGVVREQVAFSTSVGTGQALAGPSATGRGTGLPSSALQAGNGSDVSGYAPSVQTKQDHLVGARAWGPPV